MEQAVEQVKPGTEHNVRGISGSTLKIIAMACMLIDHFAASVLATIVMQMHGTISIDDAAKYPLVIIYLVMRIIGRISFPIYIFLVVEGMRHTHDRYRYFGRMAVFALISEIPFDMAFNITRQQAMGGRIYELNSQNVFFTLAIGLLALIVIRKLQEMSIAEAVRGIAVVLVTAAGMGLAYCLKTDYAGIGVLAIVIMYLLRDSRGKTAATASTCTSLLLAGVLEIGAYMAVLPISFYNGKKGINLKYIFYAYYPMHLLLLGLVRIFF